MTYDYDDHTGYIRRSPNPIKDRKNGCVLWLLPIVIIGCAIFLNFQDRVQREERADDVIYIVDDKEGTPKVRWSDLTEQAKLRIKGQLSK